MEFIIFIFIKGGSPIYVLVSSNSIPFNPQAEATIALVSPISPC